MASFNFAAFSILCTNNYNKIRDVLIFTAKFADFGYLQCFNVRGKICGIKIEKKTGIITRKTRPIGQKKKEKSET